MMSEKNKKAKKHAANRIGSDLMMTRLTLTLIIAITAVTAVICVRNASTDAVLYRKSAPVMAVVGLVLFLASAGFALFRAVKQKGSSRNAVFTPANLLGMGLVSLFCGFAYYVSPSAASAYSVVMILGAIALYFILHIYPFEFFLLSAYCLAEGMMLYTGFAVGAVNILSVIIVNVCKYGALILPVLMTAAFILYRKKNKGAWVLPGFLCAAVGLLGTAAIMIFAMHVYIPVPAVLFALVAVYLASGVIATVKMI